MSVWLSEEWFSELTRIGAEQPEHPGASARVQFVVTGAKDGDIRYYWVVEDGRVVAAGLGTLEDAELTLTESWEDALATQRGELDPSAAFMQGRIKVSGNMAKLLSLLPVTSSAEYRAAMDELNRRTELPS